MSKSGEISADESADNVYLMNHSEHPDDLSEWKSIQVLSHIILSKQMQASFYIHQDVRKMLKPTTSK